MIWSADLVKKLHNTLAYNLQNNSYYKNVWQKLGLNINDIQNYNDLQKIPTTDKETVQENLATFTCVAQKNIIEYTTTSGTLGQPLAIPLTENDLKRLAINEQASFEKMEVTCNDTVQLMLTLDRQFMAGMAYYAGLRKIGASIIRTGPGLPAMQWENIFKFKTTVLVGVPSFILKLLAFAELNGIDFQKSSIKKILVIGESIWDENLQPTIIAKNIKKIWPSVALFNTYASTEMQTAYTECIYHQGLHQNNDLIITEIIDEIGNQVADGTQGEICITTLGIEGIPLIRYRTGDMTIAYNDTCQCGHNGMSIGGIASRKKHLLKIKGTTIYPNNIFNVLNELPAIKEYCIEAYLDNNGLDNIVVYYATLDDNNIDNSLQSILQAKVKLKVDVQHTNMETILKMQFPNNSRKQMKFIDKR